MGGVESSGIPQTFAEFHSTSNTERRIGKRKAGQARQVVGSQYLLFCLSLVRAVGKAGSIDAVAATLLQLH